MTNSIDPDPSRLSRFLFSCRFDEITYAVEAGQPSGTLGDVNAPSALNSIITGWTPANATIKISFTETGNAYDPSVILYVYMTYVLFIYSRSHLKRTNIPVENNLLDSHCRSSKKHFLFQNFPKVKTSL